MEFSKAYLEISFLSSFNTIIPHSCFLGWQLLQVMPDYPSVTLSYPLFWVILLPKFMLWLANNISISPLWVMSIWTHECQLSACIFSGSKCCKFHTGIEHYVHRKQSIHTHTHFIVTHRLLMPHCAHCPLPLLTSINFGVTKWITGMIEVLPG